MTIKKINKKLSIDLIEIHIQVWVKGRNYKIQAKLVKIKGRVIDSIGLHDKTLTITFWSPDNEQGNTSIKEINFKIKIKNLKINSNLKSNKIYKSSNTVSNPSDKKISTKINSLLKLLIITNGTMLLLFQKKFKKFVKLKISPKVNSNTGNNNVKKLTPIFKN